VKLRLLTEADCRAALDMRAAIDVQATAFIALAKGQSVQGLRRLATSETPPGVAIFNPCFLRDGQGYGVKVVSDFYDNDKHGRTRMSALVALFDGETGYPQAILEGGYLTDLRTGAGTGLAARYLARRDSRVATIIGAGRVARNQLLALAETFDLETVFVCGRAAGRAEEFVRLMRGAGPRMPEDIRIATSSEQAVRASDIVVAATTAIEPVLSGAWLKPGTFVAATGAYEVSRREVDSETIRRATRRVVDSKADCLENAGDLMQPIKEGVISRNQVAEISQLIDGTLAPRQSDAEINFYKSSGVPIQDLITAQHILRRAQQLGIGTDFDIGGDG
jgi:ornithine cyclodeaminase